MRTVVLGAGALGLAAAYHLARDGHRVEVVDPRGPAGGTSRLGAGILSFGLLDDLDRRLVAASLDVWRHVLDADDEATPRRPGSVHLAGPGAPAAALEAIADGLAATGVPHRLMDPQTWVEESGREGLEVDHHGLRRVLAVDADAWMPAQAALEALAVAAVNEGATMHSGAQAHRIRFDAATGRLEGVMLGAGRRLDADRVVVALGAWSAAFLATHGLRLPALGYRTHAGRVAVEESTAFPIVHDAAQGNYLRPDGPGRVLLGDGTRLEPTEAEGFDEAPETGFLKDVLARAARRFPALEAAEPVEAWRGVLTGTPDRRPLLGPHPDAPDVVLAVGGNGFGFMRAMGLGACVAAVVAERAAPDGLTSDALERMDPVRFWPDPPTWFPLREGFTLEP